MFILLCCHITLEMSVKFSPRSAVRKVSLPRTADNVAMRWLHHRWHLCKPRGDELSVAFTTSECIC